MITSCSVCKKNQFVTVYENLSIVKCSTCGHVFYNGALGAAEIKEIYGKDYFNGAEYINYVQDKEVIQRNFKERLKRVKKYSSKGELLEIGSAYGFFLDLAKDSFNTTGFEICDDAVQYAKNKLNLNVHCGDFLKKEVNQDFYDVACMYDCIEHLVHPEDFVEKINVSMKKGGILVITTGDINRFIPRIKKSKWRLIHPPSHIHYFSKKTLCMLLEGYGFKILSITYPGIWRSNSVLLGTLFGSNRFTRNFPGYFWINTFDVVEVISTKI